MIHSITLKNFQSHKNNTIELHPGVNVLTGSSRSGKTAVLRALNWTRYNKPSGQSFNSYWNRDKKKQPIEDIESEVIFCEGGYANRKRSSIFNGYEYNGATLEAIGQDVPRDIEKIFNMSEINIQKQFDAPFLLSESNAEIARFLNKTIKLDKIDKVLSAAESKRKKLNQSILSNTELQNSLKTQIDGMGWISVIEPLIEAAERRTGRIDERKQGLEALSIQTRNIAVLMDGINNFPKNLDGVLLDMVEAEQINTSIQYDCNDIEDIEDLLAKISVCNKNIREYPDGIDEVLLLMSGAEDLDSQIESKINCEYNLKILLQETVVAEETIRNCPDALAIVKMIEEAEKLEDVINSADDSYSKLQHSINIIKQLEDEIFTFDRALKIYENKLPNICPSCGQKIQEVCCD